MQVLQPRERVQMPVTFYVDPEIVRRRRATHIHEITLSYTFHSTPPARGIGRSQNLPGQG